MDKQNSSQEEWGLCGIENGEGQPMPLLLRKNSAYSETNSYSLVGPLKQAFHTEDTISRYYHDLASRVGNAGVRKECYLFSDTDTENKDELYKRLSQFQADRLTMENTDQPYKIGPESFSLAGMINLGLDIVDQAIRSYQDLYNHSSDEDKAFYANLIREKKKERKFLRREKSFHNRFENSFFNVESLLGA